MKANNLAPWHRNLRKTSVTLVSSGGKLFLETNAKRTRWNAACSLTHPLSQKDIKGLVKALVPYIK